MYACYRKTRRRFLAAACVPASIVILPGPLLAAQFEYKLGHDQHESHPLNVNAVEFAAAVLRESGGRMAIKVFPNSELGADPSMVSQLRLGALEMHLQGVGPLSAIAPIASIGFVGFAFSDWQSAIAAMDGGVGAIIKKELDAQGILTFEKGWTAGFHQLALSNRAIRTVDDFQGLKLRVPLGPISVDMFKTLGASAVPININELYTALQTHLVDGTTGPFVDLWSNKTYELARYLSVTNHVWSTLLFLMNAEKWKALPSDLQEIVRRNANLYGIRERRAAELQNNAAQDLLARYGMRINRAEVATFRPRLGSYYARWKSEFGASAWSTLEEYSGRLVS